MKKPDVARLRSRRRTVPEQAVTAAEVGDLRQRIDVLEVEVQECRELNLRLAELTDVVGELLLPVAQRDEQRVQEALSRYAEGV